MSEKIKLEVVTPYGVIVDELAKIVMAPGIFGEFGVLSGHTPFLTVLQIGFVKFVDSKNQEKFIFVSGGYVEALPDKVVVLASSAELKKDIDLERAMKSAKRAKERLIKNVGSVVNTSEDDFDLIRAKLSLERALKRIKLAEI